MPADERGWNPRATDLHREPPAGRTGFIDGLGQIVNNMFADNNTITMHPGPCNNTNDIAFPDLLQDDINNELLGYSDLHIRHIDHIIEELVDNN
mgnify:FL=1